MTSPCMHTHIDQFAPNSISRAVTRAAEDSGTSPRSHHYRYVLAITAIGQVTARSILAKTVRERVLKGQSVRVPALAEEIGLPLSTVYSWIKKGSLAVIRFEGTVLVPAAAARPLLGLDEGETGKAA